MLIIINTKSVNILNIILYVDIDLMWYHSWMNKRVLDTFLPITKLNNKVYNYN